ncbi:MAG: 16S rRNA (uracil(1498)-N(3))-methyltransferase [Chloroherpetonaceae bacterium]|nr:16S rRNA (uracil(1498)-N(3))-methyltransferase [Chthonomonadaceae bacterium]MDW8208110.1 16S rRNA (uracil(1498)-N(3))-methyltransferase [Chloroherpetonaceae bacterium]
MYRLFLSPELLRSDTVRISGNDHRHLALVLRARPGDPIILLDNTGSAFNAVIVAVEKTGTLARITGKAVSLPEPPVRLTVAQALGKGDKFEQVVQHGTEAGASCFVPVCAERCVVTVPEDRVAGRLARWQQIARGAAEQSGRSRIPEVQAPIPFATVLAMAQSPGTTGLLLHPAPEALPLVRFLRQIDRGTHVLLAVGPEGGWSPAEVSAAQGANLLPVSLGPRVLRTETAALVAISQILYHFEQCLDVP